MLLPFSFLIVESQLQPNLMHTKDLDESIKFKGDANFIREYLHDKGVDVSDYSDEELWGLVERHLSNKNVIKRILSDMAYDMKRDRLP